MTTFNQASVLPEALDTVLRQTYPLHQIVLVDDGSRDRTESVVAPYRDRIRYIRQPDHGVAGARNAGVAVADGDLVAFLDGDDVWAPDKIERQVAAAAAYPEAALIATDGVQFEGERELASHLFGRRVRVSRGALGGGGARVGDAAAERRDRGGPDRPRGDRGEARAGGAVQASRATAARLPGE